MIALRVHTFHDEEAHHRFDQRLSLGAAELDGFLLVLLLSKGTTSPTRPQTRNMVSATKGPPLRVIGWYGRPTTEYNVQNNFAATEKYDAHHQKSRYKTHAYLVP